MRGFILIALLWLVTGLPVQASYVRPDNSISVAMLIQPKPKLQLLMPARLLHGGIPPSSSGIATFSLPTGDVLLFMRPAGSDTNCNGTVNVDDSVGVRPNCSWGSPNHAVNCGDVIIAPGGLAYGNASSPNYNFGAVSNCPSTTGGINGSGGVYHAVLLCGGSDLEACPVTSTNASGETFGVASSNWAIEGFKVTTPHGRAFISDATASGTTIRHHNAFINNITFNSNAGFGLDEAALNHNVPGNGTDYLYVIGNIAQNSAQDPVCLGAIDPVAPSTLDGAVTTHIFVHGNFSYANTQPTACVSDGEAIMYDTPDAHGVQYPAVFSHNVMWKSERYNMQIFGQNNNTTATGSTIKIYNNTSYDGNAGANAAGAAGDFNIQVNSAGFGPMLSYTNIIQNNLSLTARATAAQGGNVYAFLIGSSAGNLYTNTTIGGTGSENIFKGLASSCSGSSCDTGDNVTAFNGNGFGTNIYTSPTYANTTDLLANWVGTPNCTGKENVAQCMGYDAFSGTLTSLTPIADLQASCAGCSGKGYQLPSLTCVTNADWPSQIGPIVYLHWTGTIIQRKLGLVPNIPCGNF